MEVTSTISLIGSDYFILGLKATIFLILVLYAIFAILIVKQVSLMSQTLITPVSVYLKALAIINSGFAIGFAILAFGVL